MPIVGNGFMEVEYTLTVYLRVVIKLNQKSMKRISIVCLSGLLLLAACHNSGSSTVGTYEQEQTTESSEKSEGESHHAEGAEHKETTKPNESATADSLKSSADTSNEMGSGDTTNTNNGHEIH
jgi:hypothetical protein